MLLRLLKALILIIIIFSLQDIQAQEKKIQLETMTREEILRLSYEELLAMPLEDLVVLAGKLGVSIDEMLKMQTSVASRTDLSPRESPGIITIITAEEIRNSGARDLTDVLKTVPGFDFGYDVDGVVGLGFRGNWVHEGKALIMLDGQMMNDLVYYNTPFGNHFDVTQIKKIEIVRGPGSAIYGGNSELCVINIITKNGKDIQGISAGVTYGQLPKNFGRVNGNIQTGFIAGKWDLSLKGYVGQAHRSNRDYIESFDTVSNLPLQYSLAKNGSKIESQNINFSAQRENLSYRFIYDNYNTQCISEGTPVWNKFRSLLSSFQYDFHISDKLSVSPVFSYQYSNPYENAVLSSYSYDIHRFKSGLNLNYDISKNFNVIAGGEYYRDNGQITEEERGSYILNLDNLAFYTQILWKMAGFNVVLGGRGENNNVYGTAFAPRIGITKIINDFHFKILASEAFRSPSVGNIDVSDGLKVEETLVIESELGYKINENMFATVNIYDINITNPILYYDDGNNEAIPIVNWGYKNALKSGSNGIELEYRYKYLWGFSTINYSYYTNRWKTVPEYYRDPEQDGSVLGMPQHKISYQAGFRINDNFHIGPSVVYSGVHYGYALESDGSFGLKEFGPSLLINLNVSANDVLVTGLDLDLGVSNLLNDKTELLQPYNGGYTPYPGRDREIYARIVYNLPVFRK